MSANKLMTLLNITCYQVDYQLLSPSIPLCIGISQQERGRGMGWRQIRPVLSLDKNRGIVNMARKIIG